MTRAEFLAALEDPRMRRRGWEVVCDEPYGASAIRDRHGCCPLVVLARLRGARRLGRLEGGRAGEHLGLVGKTTDAFIYAADGRGEERLRRQMLRRLGLAS